MINYTREQIEFIQTILSSDAITAIATADDEAMLNQGTQECDLVLEWMNNNNCDEISMVDLIELLTNSSLFSGYSAIGLGLSGIVGSANEE